MSGLITSVVPVSSDWFYYGACGVTHLEYSAGAINTTDKQSALSSAIESVVLGDTRCEQHPVQAASLLLFRGRPGGHFPITAQSLNEALGALSNPILRVEGPEPSSHVVKVHFSFSLQEWHLSRMREIPGVKLPGYAWPNTCGRRIVLVTLKPRSCDRAAFRQNLVRAVTAGLKF